jgi:HEAT repeat protein
VALPAKPPNMPNTTRLHETTRAKGRGIRPTDGGRFAPQVVCALLPLLALLAFACGCRTSIGDGAAALAGADDLLEAVAERGKVDADVQPSADEQPPAGSEQTAAEPSDSDDTHGGLPSDVKTVLAKDGWIEAVPEPQPGAQGSAEAELQSTEPSTEAADESAQRLHWRYPALDDLLSRPEAERPDFASALAAGDPISVGNAAIALARLGDGSARQELTETVRTPTLSLPMRRAAAEALSTIERPSPVRHLRQLISQYGEAGQMSGHPIPELHAELVRGLLRHVEPDGDRHFTQALRSRSATVRLAAVEALGEHPEAALPEALVQLRGDTDPRIRIAVLSRLAVSEHPEARRFLEEALRDYDLQVQLAAVKGLGALGTDEAIEVLEPLLEDRAEMIRVATVGALAAAGGLELVLDATDDKSWRVRREVARALGRSPTTRAATVASELLADRSAEVQQQVVDALGHWPVDKAGPVLLEAMGSTSYRVAQSAAYQLADRWEPAKEFPASGTKEDQTAALESLRQQFRQQFDSVDAAELERITQEAVRRAQSPVDAAEVERVAELVAVLDDGRRGSEARRETVAALDRLGPVLIPALEKLVFQQQRPIPEAVWQEVLPAQAPAFERLVRLENEDPMLRRRAAADLAEVAKTEGLGRLAVYRLAELVTPEPDQLVWQSALEAIEGHASEPATRMAYVALGHGSPEVRRRGCAHLEAHPDPAHARLLLPVLEDESDQVVVAAVRALAAGGQLDEVAPLTELMRTGNDTLRLEVAVAMVRLGEEPGLAALERLAYSGDPHIRREAAAAMGRLADRRFVPTLVEMLDDYQGVRRTALASLPKVVGRDVAEDTSPQPQNMTERIDRWRQWYSRRQAGVRGHDASRGAVPAMAAEGTADASHLRQPSHSSSERGTPWQPILSE